MDFDVLGERPCLPVESYVFGFGFGTTWCIVTQVLEWLSVKVELHEID